jgi:hypothetical protein
MHRSRFVEEIRSYSEERAPSAGVIAGLDPAIHHYANKEFLRNQMDARVKPAHDDSHACDAICACPSTGGERVRRRRALI